MRHLVYGDLVDPGASKPRPRRTGPSPSPRAVGRPSRSGGGPAGRTELLWTLIARTAYDDSRMGRANAMAYVSILLSIFFTWYFFRKLMAARKHLGAF